MEALLEKGQKRCLCSYCQHNTTKLYLIASMNVNADLRFEIFLEPEVLYTSVKCSSFLFFFRKKKN